MTNAGNEGRDDLFKRFAFNSYGTRNFGHHGSYCGYGFRAGSGALMNDLNKFSHVKPDLENCEFALYIGMSPAQAGNPFKRQARQLATARTKGNFSYTVVSPALPLSSSLAAGDNNNWLPIKPGTDSALVLGMIQWILTNDKFNNSFLTQRGPNAMKTAGTAHWCNATHLVISDKDHPRYGYFLRASEVDLPFTGKPRSDTDPYVIVDAQSGELSVHTQDQPAQLFIDQVVSTQQGDVQVNRPCST